MLDIFQHIILTKIPWIQRKVCLGDLYDLKRIHKHEWETDDGKLIPGYSCRLTMQCENIFCACYNAKRVYDRIMDINNKYKSRHDFTDVLKLHSGRDSKDMMKIIPYLNKSWINWDKVVQEIIMNQSIKHYEFIKYIHRIGFKPVISPELIVKIIRNNRYDLIYFIKKHNPDSWFKAVNSYALLYDLCQKLLFDAHPKSGLSVTPKTCDDPEFIKRVIKNIPIYENISSNTHEIFYDGCIKRILLKNALNTNQ